MIFYAILFIIIFMPEIVSQKPTQKIRTEQLINFVAVKTPKKGSIELSTITQNVYLNDTNEITVAPRYENINEKMEHLYFLSKIADHLEFKIRWYPDAHPKELTFDKCENEFKTGLGKHCKMLGFNEFAQEWDIECRDSLTNEHSRRSHFHFEHESKDRWTVEGWEGREYSTYLIIHLNYVSFIANQPINCFLKMKFVFNSQMGKNSGDESREGNRDYIFVYPRYLTKTEDSDEVFTESVTTTPKIITTTTTIESTTITEFTTTSTEALTTTTEPMTTTTSTQPITTTTEPMTTTTSTQPITTTTEPMTTTTSTQPITTTTEPMTTTTSTQPITTTTEPITTTQKPIITTKSTTTSEPTTSTESSTIPPTTRPIISTTTSTTQAIIFTTTAGHPKKNKARWTFPPSGKPLVQFIPNRED